MTRYIPTRADFDKAVAVIMTVAKFEDPRINLKAADGNPLTRTVEKLTKYRDFMTPEQAPGQPGQPRPRRNRQRNQTR